MHRTLTKTILPVLLLFALLAPAIAPVTAQEEGAVSRPGEYSGYSQPIYDEWVRISQYVTVPDGTKLAVDMYRPSVDGTPVSEPLPVVWSADRYHRADVQEGVVITKLDASPYLETLVKHGYVVAAVDMRGAGASYGTRQGPFTQAEIQDLYDMTEWFAAQPWCDGNVGMYGGSYLGTAQYWAATTAPPHLKAIFPAVGPFEGYPQAYPGGVFNDKMLAMWQMGNIFLDVLMPAAPVDEDTDGSMLAEAIEEHKGNLDTHLYAKSLPYRDSVSTLPERPGPQSFLEHYLSDVSDSGIPMYHWAGWYDMFPRDQLLWFRNLDNPQKILIGPWFHSERDNDNAFIATEHLRWYDYWLKGIDNGVMDEPPIYYYTIGAPEGEEWRFAREWPLPNEEPTNYYLRSGPSGSVSSVNDGALSPTQPTDATGKDDYTVDYTATTGSPDPLKVRWTEMLGERAYGAPLATDMTPLDEKGLTYTTPPLASDVEVTGHPIVHLWVSSTAADGDFFVFLEEIDGDGVSQFVSDGILRASHRATTTPPWDHLGLPWHRSYEEDLIDLPSEPVELVFDLFPTSNIFDKGHRIRVTITGADSDNFETPELSPPPTVSVYRNTEYASYITLPTPPAVPAATGTGMVALSAISAIENLTAVPESSLPAAGKPDLQFPHGFFSFDISGLSIGETVVVTMRLPSAVPVGTQYWKYHASEGGWIQIPMGSDNGDNVITITLVDGGLGDDDLTPNGVIVDQGGPGSASVTTATGTGTASFSSDSGALGSLAAVAEGTLPAAGKPNLVFPHGFFSFTITGLTPGQTVTVTVTLPWAVPVGTQYWKYHASEGGWIQIPMGSDNGDNVITITLVDGGLGDDDLTPNGVIVDQGGPGNPPAPTGEGCFIATAAYGSYLDSHVETLRNFRDSYLMTNPVGSALVSVYYKLSPPVAEFIDDHPALKPIVRVGLLPAVAMSTVAVNTTSAEKAAIVGSLALVSVALAVWLSRRRGKGVMSQL